MQSPLVVGATITFLHTVCSFCTYNSLYYIEWSGQFNCSFKIAVITSMTSSNNRYNKVQISHRDDVFATWTEITSLIAESVNFRCGSVFIVSEEAEYIAACNLMINGQKKRKSTKISPRFYSWVGRFHRSVQISKCINLQLVTTLL